MIQSAKEAREIIRQRHMAQLVEALDEFIREKEHVARDAIMINITFKHLKKVREEFRALEKKIDAYHEEDIRMGERYMELEEVIHRSAVWARSLTNNREFMSDIGHEDAAACRLASKDLEDALRRIGE